MDLQFADYQGADLFFGRGLGLPEWESVEAILHEMPLYLKGSQQAGKLDVPILDPVATNRHLTEVAYEEGWQKVLVPPDLPFGLDWEGGRRRTLAEWQFSTYPYLCNNVVRADIAHRERLPLDGIEFVGGLLIVTRSLTIPASNGVLSFEQAIGQLDRMAGNNFRLPVRVVGVTIPEDVEEVDATWVIYPSQRSRVPTGLVDVTASVVSRSMSRKYQVAKTNLFVQD